MAGRNQPNIHRPLKSKRQLGGQVIVNLCSSVVELLFRLIAANASWARWLSGPLGIVFGKENCGQKIVCTRPLDLINAKVTSLVPDWLNTRPVSGGGD